jgi:hypothetical protein
VLDPSVTLVPSPAWALALGVMACLCMCVIECVEVCGGVWLLWEGMAMALALLVLVLLVLVRSVLSPQKH